MVDVSDDREVSKVGASSHDIPGYGSDAIKKKFRYGHARTEVPNGGCLRSI
jgi:hypothetical protein